MCGLCDAKCVSVQLLPNFYLEKATQDGSFMKAGDYGIAKQNDPFVIFNIEIPEKKCNDN